jgi:hypothetical protein
MVCGIVMDISLSAPLTLALVVAPNISDPVCDCSTLELISPDHWITLDGCVHVKLKAQPPVRLFGFNLRRAYISQF